MTGIVQEGSQAIVTVEVAFAKNAVYRTIEGAISKVGSKPGFTPSRLPAEADLARTGTHEIAFRRYDDGWRVEKSKPLF